MAGTVTTIETTTLPATKAAAGNGVTRSWRAQPEVRSWAMITAPPSDAAMAP